MKTSGECKLIVSALVRDSFNVEKLYDKINNLLAQYEQSKVPKNEEDYKALLILESALEKFL